MPNFVPVFYAPDTDNAWSVAPGTLTSLVNFAPLQGGNYGSMGSANLFGAGTLTGTDILIAYAFRQVDGSVRFLAFRPDDIDEYSSSGTRTNRAATLGGASMWSATAWGNQIIACAAGLTPQSSTGAGFSALSGSPPKARMVASNLDFVMFADVDDSGSNVYPDMVWWSGLRNPTTWTPDPKTQAGNQRILQSPGPIRALVAYNKTFVVFKDNAIIVGNYIGPQLGFAWQKVSSRIGCVNQNAVCELDGKLYFFHTSGFYEFDGQQIRNIGLPVNQTFLTWAGYADSFGGNVGGIVSAPTSYGLDRVSAAADDLEGVVWFSMSVYKSPSEYTRLVGYNPRCGKWGVWGYANTTSSTTPSPPVKASSADMQAFKADTSGRIYQVWNTTGGSTLRSIRYPYACGTGNSAASFVTGVIGENDTAGHNTNLYLRHRYGTDALTASDVSGSLVGYADESLTSTPNSVTPTYNAEMVALQGSVSARYRTYAASYASKKVILAGIALDDKPAGKR